MLYVVQREDVNSFSPADDIDPVYGELLRAAAKAGVEILAYQCKLTPSKIELLTPIKVKL